MILPDVVRAVFTSPLNPADAAAYYGVSQSYVSQIRHRKWRREITAGLALPKWLDTVPSKKHKLTIREATEIRELYAAGVFNQPELGRLYGLSQPAIYGVVHYNTYKPKKDIPWPGQKKISPPIKSDRPLKSRKRRTQRRKCRLLDASKPDSKTKRS